MYVLKVAVSKLLEPRLRCFVVCFRMMKVLTYICGYLLELRRLLSHDTASLWTHLEEGRPAKVELSLAS